MSFDKIGIIGHFGFGKNCTDGQTIKTKTIANTLKSETSSNYDVVEVDTDGLLFIIKLPFLIFRLLRKCQNIIILPANRGIRIITPLLLLFNNLFHRRLHYVVIGGWLPSLCLKKNALARKLKTIDFIYVETNCMKLDLEKQGFNNVLIMPNFKNLIPIAKEEIVLEFKEPYKLCTFSRVMKEKGVELACKAVEILNAKYNYTKYLLDIYGPINDEQKEWFNKLSSDFPKYINYKGCVDYNSSVNVLKQYYALLFPTFYEGEGLAGTLLDAMAAALPIVASDWKYNKEIINNSNGILVEANNVQSLVEGIERIKVSRLDCLNEFQKYSSENAIKILLNNLV